MAFGTPLRALPSYLRKREQCSPSGDWRSCRNNRALYPVPIGKRRPLREADHFIAWDFRTRLATLKQVHGVWLDHDLNVRVLSIVKARNCLVHRAGVVTPRDVTSEQGLELAWLALAIIIKGPSGEREVELPAMAEGGESVAVGTRPRARIFPMGVSISVTATEFDKSVGRCFCSQRGWPKRLKYVARKWD